MRLNYAYKPCETNSLNDDKNLIKILLSSLGELSDQIHYTISFHQGQFTLPDFFLLHLKKFYFNNYLFSIRDLSV